MPANTVCLLANILIDLESLEDAIELLKAARSGSPADFWINHDLGNALRAQEKPASTGDAVRFLTVAAALKPDSPGVLSNLGSALGDLGTHDEAVVACREAIRLQPDLAEAHSNLGNALRTQRKLGEAAVSVREAIRLTPDFAVFHGTLGLILADQRKYGEAVAAYRVAIRLKPDYAEAYPASWFPDRPG